jgi:sortase (surface protein transpeptidase)
MTKLPALRGWAGAFGPALRIFAARQALTGLIGVLALAAAAGGLRLITIGLRPPEGPRLPSAFAAQPYASAEPFASAQLFASAQPVGSAQLFASAQPVASGRSLASGPPSRSKSAVSLPPAGYAAPPPGDAAPAGGAAPAAPQASTDPTTARTAQKRPVSSSTIKRSAPTRLDIPAIDVHTPVIRLGLNPDHTVELPPLQRDSPAGWYEKGASPGEIGPAVMLGHVDSAADGPAVFYRLNRLHPGDTISVTRADRSVAVFVVQKLVEVAKTDFPTNAVYGPTRSAELRLVTCGGQFDRARASYRDNIIVFAGLASLTAAKG